MKLEKKWILALLALITNVKSMLTNLLTASEMEVTHSTSL